MKVKIAAYDRDWSVIFDAERRRLETALGAGHLAIEHIGSTSVPELAAKPTIDILLVVGSLRDVRELGSQLNRLGYQESVRERGHIMFKLKSPSVHLHVLEEGDEKVDELILFRDWLRSSSSDRAAYEASKLLLADQEWPDQNAYAQAKSHIVENILRRAKAVLKTRRGLKAE
jgi:GrpB-like predicted nucleotidyltransferase (UPF0157 family)